MFTLMDQQRPDQVYAARDHVWSVCFRSFMLSTPRHRCNSAWCESVQTCACSSMFPAFNNFSDDSLHFLQNLLKISFTLHLCKFHKFKIVSLFKYFPSFPKFYLKLLLQHNFSKTSIFLLSFGFLKTQIIHFDEFYIDLDNFFF